MAADTRLQANGAQPGPLTRWRRERPDLPELSILVSFYEQVPRQNAHPIEKPLSHAVSLRQLEYDCPRIQFANRNRFSANNQQIALGRGDALGEVNAKREQDIVRVEWMSVRETQAFSQSERVLEAVWRNFPGLRQSGFRELCRAIDVNQVRLHCADHVARRRIRGRQRIQSFGLGTERNNKPAAGPPDFSWKGEYFFSGICLRRKSGGGLSEERKTSQKEGQTKPAAGRNRLGTHPVGMRYILPSSLYVATYAAH